MFLSAGDNRWPLPDYMDLWLPCNTRRARQPDDRFNIPALRPRARPVIQSTDARPPLPPLEIPQVYKLVQLCKSYREGTRERRVLDGVDAELLRGRFTAIRGRSGSGKSTLLNLLGGLDLPDRGEIRLGGLVLNDLDERRRSRYRRRHIGFVFQSFNLVPTLTAGENVAFPLDLNGVRGAEAERRVVELLESLSLADRLDSYPDQLSSGEQQRIAIARAVVHAPDVVLADEPTGNLDSGTEGQILSLLASLPRERGVTLVCATHSDEVAAAADEVYLLEAGRLRRA